MYWHDHDISTTGEIAMWIMMGLFWIAVAAVLVWTVRGFAGERRGAQEDARTILDRRLAAGEIDVAEYSALRAALEDRSDPLPQ